MTRHTREPKKITNKTGGYFMCEPCLQIEKGPVGVKSIPCPKCKKTMGLCGYYEEKEYEDEASTE